MSINRRSLLLGAAAGGLLPAIRPLRAAAQSADHVLISQASQGFLYVPSYVAQGAGFFAEEGVDPEFISVRVTGGVTAALTSNQVQFAYAGASHPILAQAHGVDVIAIGAMVARPQADIVIQPEIAARLGLSDATPMAERIRALRGLSIAINGFGGALDTIIRFLLRSEGLDPERDVTLTAIPDASGILAAFGLKRIDAFIFSPPTSSIGVTQHGGHLLVNISGGDFEPLNDLLYGALLCESSWAEANRDVTTRLMRAYARALTLIATDSDATREVTRPFFDGLEPAIFETAFESVRSSYPRNPRITDAYYQRNIEFLRAANGEVPEVELSRLYDNSYLDAG